MAPTYEGIGPQLPSRGTTRSRLAYTLLISIVFFTMISAVMNTLIFIEFYEAINFIKNDKQLKNLTKSLSHINLEAIVEVFKEVKVSDLRSILGKITETEVEDFFLEVDQCIMKC